MVWIYKFISPIKANADAFETRHKAKHPGCQTRRSTKTGTTIKDKAGKAIQVCPEPVTVETVTEKDKDGKDVIKNKDDMTTEETEMFIVESDVFP